MQKVLMITGASGKTGMTVLDHVLDTYNIPPGRVVAGTRTPGKLASYAERGVIVRQMDFDKPETLVPAMTGVDRLLIISTGSIEVPGMRIRQQVGAVEAAARAGVRHIAYTSLPSASSSSISFARDHSSTEEAMFKSGMTWTALRAHWHMESLLQVLPQAVATGEWRTAVGQGRTPWITYDDLACANAAALVGGAENMVLEVTGPRAYGSEEVAALVNDLVGSKIKVVHLTDEERGRELAAAGLPPAWVDGLLTCDVSARMGELDVVSDAVRMLTGRTPRDLPSFLAANKEALLKAPLPMEERPFEDRY